MYQTFWNYQQKKSGEIVISKEEIQKMLDQAYQAGYNQAFVEQCKLAKNELLVNAQKKEESDPNMKNGNINKADRTTSSDISATNMEDEEDSTHDEFASHDLSTPMTPPQLPDMEDLIPDIDV